ncbi:MAG: hypothetical protein RJA70_490 [Pseudomonadota bacterium]|jgi:RND family efflux transporter MFP subunit
MKRFTTLLIFGGLVTSCHSHSHKDGDDHADHGDDHGHGADQNDERPALSFTHWTLASELFIELPALVVGQESKSAAHVTRLSDFAALAEGQVSLVLRSDSGEERFDSPAPTVPGIFRPVAQPKSAGNRRLIVLVRAQGLTAEHDLGEVSVYESVAAARAANPEPPEVSGRIPFLKEQQWPMEFGTAMVAERPIRTSLNATGVLRARSDGDVIVSAPAAGRIATSGRVFPRLGDRVAVDDPIAVLAPRLEAADLASLELAVKSAELEQRFAQRERERLEALQAEGAVPERRVLDAVHLADSAQASLTTAQRRLSQFSRVQRTAGRGEGVVQLRAPLAGTITAVNTAAGAFVEAGTPLFRVTDTTQLWLEARVAEVDVPMLGTPRGAAFFVEGTDTAIELGADSLVARGHVIDPISRTLELNFAVDNAGSRFAVGTFARAFISTGDERSALAVPVSAVVDDNGVFVVFVQVEGEAFERRPLRLGTRDRGYVEVVSGVRPGEHVVTRGAWSVKLAAASGAIPAHGHSH